MSAITSGCDPDHILELFWGGQGAPPAAGPGFRGVRGRVVDCAYGYQEEDQEEASKNEETCRQKGQANEEEG